MTGEAAVLHATLIARRGPRGWRGALLRGASGGGKSTLALRALEAGFRLVADDRVRVWVCAGRVFGRAPPVLAGLIEVRHVEVAARCGLRQSPVDLVVDLDLAPGRLCEGETAVVAGRALPRIALRPFEACAPARVAQALEALATRA